MFTTLKSLTTHLKILFLGVVAVAISAAVPVLSPKANALTLPNGTVLPSSAFMKVDSHGMPARWDPCAPAYWKLYYPGLPVGGRRAVLIAVHVMKVATGLNFVYGGAATAAEFANPPAHTLVIGFTSHLASTRAGLTRTSFAGGANDSLVILSARVAINRLVANRTAARFPEMIPALLHELGHAVGLAHSRSSHEVMYPYLVPLYKYQRMDALKLSVVGVHSGCHPLAA